MKVRQVYFIQARMLGHVKIGLSDDVQKRLRDLQVGSPDELFVRGVMLTVHAEELEAKYHARFRHLRIRGEWFRNDRELEDLMQTVFSVEEAKASTCPVIALNPYPREPGSRRLNRGPNESEEAFLRRAIPWLNKRLAEQSAAA